MRKNRQQIAYRWRVIVPRYLAGETAKSLAAELGICHRSLAVWLSSHRILRGYNKSTQPNDENKGLPRWLHVVNTPSGKAVAAAMARGVTTVEALANELPYSHETIRQARAALRHMEQLQNAGISNISSDEATATYNPRWYAYKSRIARRKAAAK